jgi:hypothetical protein
MRFTLRTYSRRSKERFCVQHPEASGMVGESTWGILEMDELHAGSSEPVKVCRCFLCVRLLCGFTPMWGRVLREPRQCERCGRSGKVIKFMTSIPYPGSRKVVCVECFKGVELVGDAVVDQG